jgi:hypothetical protein
VPFFTNFYAKKPNTAPPPPHDRMQIGLSKYTPVPTELGVWPICLRFSQCTCILQWILVPNVELGESSPDRERLGGRDLFY